MNQTLKIECDNQEYVFIVTDVRIAIEKLENYLLKNKKAKMSRYNVTKDSWVLLKEV